MSTLYVLNELKSSSLSIVNICEKELFRTRIGEKHHSSAISVSILTWTLRIAALGIASVGLGVTRWADSQKLKLHQAKTVTMDKEANNRPRWAIVRTLKLQLNRRRAACYTDLGQLGAISALLAGFFNNHCSWFQSSLLQ